MSALLMKPFAATGPFSFVLFGASGNLAKLKIYPALYVLFLKKRFPKDFAIVGYSRSPMDERSFRLLVDESIHADLPEVNRQTLDAFLQHVHYQQGLYDSVEDFKNLRQKLESLETGSEQWVRLAYLSVPPTVLHPILQNLCAGGVHKKDAPFRVIVEKPVGHDLVSFEKVRGELQSCFRDDEIFLLDHYLGKEAVRNIYYLRYANPLLERLFKNTLIHHVEMTASESLGLEGRAGYFDHTGTLRDMVQSHLFMMTALLTMPVKDTEEGIREGRFSAIEQLYLPHAASLDDVILQGQYTHGTIRGERVPGYLEEEGVESSSRTNTYVALKINSRDSRWQGVPFYLRSGKRLGKKETRVSIVFRSPRNVGEGNTDNRLDIILQGEAGMRVHLQTKVGGTTPSFRPLILEDPLVCTGDCLPEHGLLLLEAIHGKQTWFLGFDEIRTSWRLIDPLQHHLDQSSITLHPYPAGSAGPEAVVEWVAKDGVTWSQ